MIEQSDPITIELSARECDVICGELERKAVAGFEIGEDQAQVLRKHAETLAESDGECEWTIPRADFDAVWDGLDTAADELDAHATPAYDADDVEERREKISVIDTLLTRLENHRIR